MYVRYRESHMTQLPYRDSRCDIQKGMHALISSHVYITIPCINIIFWQPLMSRQAIPLQQQNM